jgi:hypothetical protein
MISITKFFIPVLVITLLISIATALPTTGVPSDVTANQANITCGAVTGTTAWVTWGQTENGQIWRTENFTATAGTGYVRIWGSPLMTNTQYYAKCCDSTGCTATAQTFTTLPATVIALTTFSAGWQNLTQSHFNLMYIVPAILGGYTAVIPVTVFFGLTLAFIVLGYWRKNRAVRLVSITFIIIGSFLMTTNTGLEMGMPGILQSIGAAALAAGISGIFLSFIKRA